ncbi:lipopolysaccharide-induced tumor necrosis factor-alpha factor homolog isoform X2 [Trichoplusia ni]|uniref:Lipopolysaccharide-induced tumor necrosis factor-alpha factor homolog isoform X2 n=1 Tax=Trichoplusia ni TaxID=7111 RepID=A0A7E5VCQ7_TRINI|nr:lipopolysaccharide-induced tumor necrosis factor-alpha factor homolog isoform X2 [Trichoplusia ni]
MESNAYQQITQNADNVCIEMDLLKVGSEPVGMRCPFCQEDVMTKAHYRNTSITHIIAIVFGILFWWMCCCLIPYFVKRWKNVEHYCPNCHKYLGMYTRTTIL